MDVRALRFLLGTVLRVLLRFLPITTGCRNFVSEICQLSIFDNTKKSLTDNVQDCGKPRESKFQPESWAVSNFEIEFNNIGLERTC